jgi:hypothetical protein
MSRGRGTYRSRANPRLEPVRAAGFFYAPRAGRKGFAGIPTPRIAAGKEQKTVCKQIDREYRCQGMFGTKPA